MAASVEEWVVAHVRDWIAREGKRLPKSDYAELTITLRDSGYTDHDDAMLVTVELRELNQVEGFNGSLHRQIAPEAD